MDFTGLGSYIVITAIAFFVGYCFKSTDKVDNKYIPAIVGLTGIVLGVAAYVMHVSWFPAEDPIQAIADGMYSGIGATWFHQLCKQLTGE